MVRPEAEDGPDDGKRKRYSADFKAKVALEALRGELTIAHAESAEQPLTYYEAMDRGHAWLRVLPRTRRGAPARGALVTLRAGGRRQLRVIDGGSGYLCQMEPVAHFGLGALDGVESVEVRWPDGAVAYVEAPPVRRTIEVRHPAG